MAPIVRSRGIGFVPRALSVRLTKVTPKVTVPEKCNSLMKPERLSEARNALLNLHKALVDSERVRYEKVVGEIKSSSHFLQLLTGDPWFAWLHPLSQLIVSMDEAIDGKEPLTAAMVDTLLRQAKLLLVPREKAPGFAGSYFDALQNDPAVVLAHADATKIVGRPKSAANRNN